MYPVWAIVKLAGKNKILLYRKNVSDFFYKNVRSIDTYICNIGYQLYIPSCVKIKNGSLFAINSALTTMYLPMLDIYCSTSQAVADVFTFETPPKLHSTPEPLLKQPHNYRLPQTDPQRSTQRAVENFRPIQPASSAFVLHPHSAFKLTNSNAQQVSGKLIYCYSIKKLEN